MEVLKTIPAIVLSAEFFLGGIGRASRWPFPALHERIYQKSTRVAPTLYPVVPFKDTDAHLRWVGCWMIATGALLAIPQTRGNNSTLGLVLFWTGAGAYSQAKTNMPFWLPITNAALGLLVWWLDRTMP